MSNIALAAELIAKASEQYLPESAGEGIVHFKDLRIYVAIKEEQAQLMGNMALFICEITATSQPTKPGMTITSVGIGNGMESAISQATGQWVAGVLPVLARWRDKHTCLVGDLSLVETRGGAFEAILSPVVIRGGEASVPQGTTEDDGVFKVVRQAVESDRLKPRVHWLELFVALTNGEVQATCRLDNRDWIPGQEALKKFGETFPETDSPINSCRQFVLLLPRHGDRETITVPSFWSWLFGMA